MCSPAYFLRTLQHKGSNNFAAKLQSRWPRKGVLFFKSGLCSEQEEAAPALYWSFEEKYKQANPLYLTQCDYPTVDAVGAERSKEAVEGTVIVGWGFSAHFSNCSREEPAPRSLHFLWWEFAICTQMLYWFSSSTIGSSQVSALFAIE